MELPDIDYDEMRKNLEQVMPDPQYVDIMVGILQTSSQTAVAKSINLSQGKVRYRFLRGLDIVRKCAESGDETFKLYVQVFEKISNNFNILRSLESQSRWKNKFEDTIMTGGRQYGRHCSAGEP